MKNVIYRTNNSLLKTGNGQVVENRFLDSREKNHALSYLKVVSSRVDRYLFIYNMKNM